MFSENIKLGGELVRYGITQNKETIFELELAKPIHNTITKHMLNGLLQFNGDNSTVNVLKYYLWAKTHTYSGTGSRTGVINYAAYGNGTGETSTNDTELKNRISDFSSNHITTNVSYSGYRVLNGDQPTLQFRVSYNFPAVSEETIIKEFGVYHKIEPNGEIKLTARVQLESPITLQPGEGIFFVYQMNLSFEKERIISLPKIGMYAKKINWVGAPVGWENSARYINFPVDTNSDFLPNESYGHVKNIVWSTYSYSQSDYSARACGIDVLIGFPNDININGNFVRYNSSPTEKLNPNPLFLISASVEDYVIDSFRRDYIFGCTNDLYDDMDLAAIAINGNYYLFGDMVNGEFVPQKWHKPANTWLSIKCRQSFSTDLLTPTP